MWPEITLRNDPTGGRRESDQRRRQKRTRWIALHPFPSARENSDASGQNGLVLRPAFKILGQRERGSITTLRIFLQTLQTDYRKLAIYFGIPQTPLSWLSIQQQLDRLVRRSPSKRWMAC